MEFDKDSFFGKPGELVPVVSVEDLKKAWEFTHEDGRDSRTAIGMGLWQQILPDANIPAVTYRRAMLGMLEMFLEATYPGGKISDNALKVASEIEMKWIPVGVPQKGSPFNAEDFLSTVWGMSMAEKN